MPKLKKAMIFLINFIFWLLCGQNEEKILSQLFLVLKIYELLCVISRKSVSTADILTQHENPLNSSLGYQTMFWHSQSQIVNSILDGLSKKINYLLRFYTIMSGPRCDIDDVRADIHILTLKCINLSCSWSWSSGPELYPFIALW